MTDPSMNESTLRCSMRRPASGPSTSDGSTLRRSRRRRTWLVGLALALATIAPLAVAHAQSPAPPPAAAPGSTPAAGPPPSTGGDGWEKVDANAMRQPGETIPARNLVAAAYGFIWLMALGFVVSVWRRSARLDRELDELRAKIDARAGKD